jgi:hypothetical protein
MTMLPLSHQVAVLFILAVPVACVSWTVTHEDVFQEVREFFVRRSQSAQRLPVRKFFYLFTCEYCFSHYVAAFFLLVTRYTLLYPDNDWRGYLIAWFALVWIANIYMGVFGHLRLDIRKERVEIKAVEKKVEQIAEPTGEQPKRVA